MHAIKNVYCEHQEAFSIMGSGVSLVGEKVNHDWGTERGWAGKVNLNWGTDRGWAGKVNLN